MLKNIIIYNLLKLSFFKIINYFKIYKFRLNITLDNLIKDGIEINTVYDIGAFHGEWSQFFNYLFNHKNLNLIYYLIY
jgi:hypothetical protein